MEEEELGRRSTERRKPGIGPTVPASSRRRRDPEGTGTQGPGVRARLETVQEDNEVPTRTGRGGDEYSFESGRPSLGSQRLGEAPVVGHEVVGSKTEGSQRRRIRQIQDAVHAHAEPSETVGMSGLPGSSLPDLGGAHLRVLTAVENPECSRGIVSPSVSQTSFDTERICRESGKKCSKERAPDWPRGNGRQSVLGRRGDQGGLSSTRLPWTGTVAQVGIPQAMRPSR